PASSRQNTSQAFLMPFVFALSVRGCRWQSWLHASTLTRRGRLSLRGPGTGQSPVTTRARLPHERGLLHPILDLDSPACDFFEEGFGGHVALLQDRSVFADRSRAHHLQDDGGGESGGAHHGAHIALGIVVVDHGEGRDSAFEFSA